MKIAIDLTPLYGRKWTGVELYAIDLYHALLELNYEVIPIFHVIRIRILSNRQNVYCLKIWPCRKLFGL